MRSVWGIATTILAVALSAALSGKALPPTRGGAPAEQILVTLATDKKVYKVGQPVLVTCLVQNVSEGPLYVYRHVQVVTGANAGLRVTIVDARNRSPLGGLSSDAFFLPYAPSTPIERILREQWVLLRPGEARSYQDFLSGRPTKPGRYRLTGTYFDHTLRYLTEPQREALRKLEHPIVDGDFPTNSIWIEIQP